MRQETVLLWDGSGISNTMCKQSAPRSTDNHANTSQLNFYRARCSSFLGRCIFHTPNSVKAMKAQGNDPSQHPGIICSLSATVNHATPDIRISPES